MSWAAVVKAVSKAGYNRIARNYRQTFMLFHKLAALYRCVSTYPNQSLCSISKLE